MNRALSLQLHDVYYLEPSESGFRGAAADRYKLCYTEFESHLDQLSETLKARPDVIPELYSERNPSKIPVLLTFDDGGSSYYSIIADKLESLGWRGHCLVTTGCIGKQGFLDVRQLRELHERGHCIGTHSVTHPTRFSKCNWQEMVREWSDSKNALQDILGDQINIGSVPGGYYSRSAALAAQEVGITTLFTSEPTTRTQRVGLCDVIGRYTIRPGCRAEFTKQLVSMYPALLAQEWLSWNSKKVLKQILGNGYTQIAGLVNKSWQLKP